MEAPQPLSCFVCSQNTIVCSVICKSYTNYSKTPYAQCISQVLGSDFLVVVSPDDKVCQQCSSLIDERDKLKLDLNKIETTLADKLKEKYQLLVGNNSTTPPSAEFQCSRLEECSSSSYVNAEVNEGALVQDLLSCAKEAVARKNGNNKKRVVQSYKDVASTSTSKYQTSTLKISQLYHCEQCQFFTLESSEMNSHMCPSKIVNDKLKSNNASVQGSEVSLKLKCKLCNYEEANASSLKPHMMECHQGLVYHCEICQVSFHSDQECCAHINFARDDCTNREEANFEDSSDDLPLAVRKAKQNSNCNTVMIPCVESTYIKSEKMTSKYKTTNKNKTVKTRNNKAKTVKPSKSSKAAPFKNVNKEIENFKETNSDPDVITRVSCIKTLNESEDISLVKVSGLSESKKIFECGFCSIRMDSREELQEHFKTHSAEKITCIHCKARIPNFKAYKKHLMYHSKPNESITCSECGDVANDIDSLKFHMRVKHGCKLTCAHCDEQFTYVVTLKSHIRRHIESHKYFCNSCNIYFSRIRSYRHHMQFVHRDPKCKICGKIIEDSRKLRDHEKRHLTEKEGLCPYCGKVLKTRNALKIHLMQHTGLYKYKCNICNKGLTTRHAYNEHMNRHSSNPKLLYTCDKCGKQFNHNGSFSLHRKWHDNPYPYTCEYCGLKIRHTSLLRNHIRKVHTGEKPHECPHCHKRFLTKGQLRKHVPQHTGIFEFNCIDCNKGWVKKEYYNNHRFKVHGDPLPKRVIRSKADYKLVIPDDGPPPPIPIMEDSSDDNMANEIQQTIEYL